MKPPRPPRHRAGFTLIEIAIVLVIIGLLLGGVLKGQALINNAKVKNLINDFKAVPLFVYGYQDRFRAIPGDDPNAQAHLGSAAIQAPNGAALGNGRIDGVFNSDAATDESLLFWQHVRLANLTAGSTRFSSADAIRAAAPRNAEGGRLGIQSDSPIIGMAGTFFVCSDAIQGKFAKQIDIAIDDGQTDSGSLRVMLPGYNGAARLAIPLGRGDGDAPSTGNLVDDAPYTVCLAH